MPTIDEDLNQLEKDLRQLQIEYDTYFSGGRPRPPMETEWRVQNLIRRLNESGGKQKFAQRFRFNSMAARYAKYSEIWRQRSKRMELGYTPYGYSRVARELEQKRLAEAAQRHEARIHGDAARVAFADPLKEPEKLQELYRKMVEAKRNAGEKADINFEQFHKFVRQKTTQLKKQMSCLQVEYSVTVEDGKVRLKAKAI